jgi:prepilin-type processing-associated H-X9-DG protein
VFIRVHLQPKAAWDTGTVARDLDNSPLAKYLGQRFNPGVWVCPTDSVDRHQTIKVNGVDVRYAYSYTINSILSCKLRHKLGSPVAVQPVDPGDRPNIPDRFDRGNACFCDGHAEFITRDYAHSPTLRHWDPTF